MQQRISENASFFILWLSCKKSLLGGHGKARRMVKMKMSPSTCKPTQYLFGHFQWHHKDVDSLFIFILIHFHFKLLGSCFFIFLNRHGSHYFFDCGSIVGKQCVYFSN